MLQLYKQVSQAAPGSAPVLIVGESGTGKELVARALHAHGPRADRPFLSLNCAGLTDLHLESALFGHVRGAFPTAVNDRVGLFEAARTGTLFLDNITEMSAAMQAQILRVLQEREVRPMGASGGGGRRRPRARRRLWRCRGRHHGARVPAGPVLPPRRLPDSRAAAARASSGHPPARRALLRRRECARRPDGDHLERCHRAPASAGLARQCPGAGKRDRTTRRLRTSPRHRGRRHRPRRRRIHPAGDAPVRGHADARRTRAPLSRVCPATVRGQPHPDGRGPRASIAARCTGCRPASVSRSRAPRSTAPTSASRGRRPGTPDPVFVAKPMCQTRGDPEVPCPCSTSRRCRVAASLRPPLPLRLSRPSRPPAGPWSAWSCSPSARNSPPICSAPSAGWPRPATRRRVLLPVLPVGTCLRQAGATVAGRRRPEGAVDAQQRHRVHARGPEEGDRPERRAGVEPDRDGECRQGGDDRRLEARRGAPRRCIRDAASARHARRLPQPPGRVQGRSRGRVRST